LYINTILRADLTKNGISHPCFYGDVIHKGKTFKSDIS